MNTQTQAQSIWERRRLSQIARKDPEGRALYSILYRFLRRQGHTRRQAIDIIIVNTVMGRPL